MRLALETLTESFNRANTLAKQVIRACFLSWSFIEFPTQLHIFSMTPIEVPKMILIRKSVSD
jgi:hypothetical protein